MTKLSTYGVQYDDLESALQLLMKEFLEEKKLKPSIHDQFAMLLFGRYMAEHQQQLSELLKKVKRDFGSA